MFMRVTVTSEAHPELNIKAGEVVNPQLLADREIIVLANLAWIFIGVLLILASGLFERLDRLPKRSGWELRKAQIDVWNCEKAACKRFLVTNRRARIAGKRVPMRWPATPQ